MSPRPGLGIALVLVMAACFATMDTTVKYVGALFRAYVTEKKLIETLALADQHGISDGDIVRVSSRRGSMTLPAKVVSTIRPDTLFIPYHWAGRQAANQLTNRALDPVSKIPEYKVSAVRVERVGPGGSTIDNRDLTVHEASPE